MLQGFYSAASGMFMQQRGLNVIANNLANAQTPGYKTTRLLSTTFEQTLLTRFEKYGSGGIGTGEPVRIVSEVADLFDINGLTGTNRPFDVALNSPGFFNIQGEDGQTYLTRDGQFDLDEDGYLVLRDRGRVLGTGGPLKLDTSDITISETGQITNSITGAALGQLAVTNPGEEAEYQIERNGLYTSSAGVGAQQQDVVVVQGALEDSNVVLTEEMTAMIMAQRNFQSASAALKMIDATYSKAVNIAAL